MGFGGLGAPEILLLAFVVVLLFGGKRIAGIGKGMGEGIASFKHGLSNPLTKDNNKE
jgi:sec-independent protein translocase protein TatA